MKYFAQRYFFDSKLLTEEKRFPEIFYKP